MHAADADEGGGLWLLMCAGSTMVLCAGLQLCCTPGSSMGGQAGADALVCMLAMWMGTCSPVHAPSIEGSCAATCLHPFLQIERHDSHESTWFIHDGNVYDATKFLKDHPGKMMLCIWGVGVRLVRALQLPKQGLACEAAPVLDMLQSVPPHWCASCCCSSIKAQGKHLQCCDPKLTALIFVMLPCCCAICCVLSSSG